MNDKTIFVFPQTLLDLLKKHLPLHILIDYFKSTGLPTAKSWEDVTIKHGVNVAIIKQWLSEIMCHGRKSCFVYDVSSDIINILKFDHENSDVCDSIKSPSSEYKFFNKIEDDRFLSISFAIKRVASETHVLTGNELTESARSQYFTNGAVVKAYVPINFCAFDSIVYDKLNKYLFLLIDDTRHSIPEKSEDLAAKFLAYIDRTGSIRKSITPLSLHSHMSKMYSYPDEGLVCQLSFECGTGAVRDEKLKKGQLDLRKEQYHVKGKAAVGALYPYKIEIYYPSSIYKEVRSEASFSIKGRRADIQSKSGFFKFEITSCTGIAEFKFVANRLGLYFDHE